MGYVALQFDLCVLNGHIPKNTIRVAFDFCLFHNNKMAQVEEIKQVAGIRLRTLSKEEKIEISGGQKHGIVINNTLKQRVSGSLFDPNMGPLYPSCNESGCAGSMCIHVKSKDRTCLGRYGRIELPMPIIEPIDHKIASMVISCICPYCGRLKKTRETLEREGVFKLHGHERLSKVHSLCNGTSDAPVECENKSIGIGRECSSQYPRVYLKEMPDIIEGKDAIKRTKKIKRVADQEKKGRNIVGTEQGTIGVFYYYIVTSGDEPKNERPLGATGEFPLDTTDYMTTKTNKTKKGERTRYDYSLSLNDALIMLRIANKYSETLGFTQGSKPEDLVTEIVLVTPPIMRQENIDLGDTKFYTAIIAKSNILREVLAKYKGNHKWVSPWSEDYNPAKKALQEMPPSVAFYYLDLFKAIHTMTVADNSSNTGGYGSSSSKKSVMDKIKGKEGSVRMNLTMQLDFCSRTVAGAHMDKIDTVYIPPEIAASMTTKESIHRYNIVHMNSRCDQGLVPRIDLGSGKSRCLARGKAKKIRLGIGNVVDRYLSNGDIAEMWRSPTLATEGVRCFKVSFDPMKVRKILGYPVSSHGPQITDYVYGTSRFNLAVAHSPNMDFDGDEIGMKYFQKIKHIIGGIVYGLPQRSVKEKARSINALGVISQFSYVAHMLTDSDNFVPVNFINDFLSNVSEVAKAGLKTLKRRLELHGVSPFSGKGVFSIILPENMYFKGSILVKNGVLLNGRVGDQEIGYNPNTIINHVAFEYGETRGYYLVQDLYTLLKMYSHVNGLSLSIVDMVPMEDVLKPIRRTEGEIRKGIDLEPKKPQKSQKSESPKDLEHFTTLLKKGELPKGRNIPEMNLISLESLLREMKIQDVGKYKSELMKIADIVPLNATRELKEISELKNRFCKMLRIDGVDPNSAQDIFELIDNTRLNSKLIMNPRRTLAYKNVLREANMKIAEIPDMKSQLEIQSFKRAIAKGVLGQAKMGLIKDNLSANMRNIMDSGCAGSLEMLTKLTVGLGGTVSGDKIMGRYIGKRVNAYQVLSVNDLKANNIIDQGNLEKIGEYPEHFKDLGISETSIYDGLSVQQIKLEAARARHNEVRGKIGEKDNGVGASCRLHRNLNHSFGSTMAQYDNTARENGKIYSFAIHMDGYETKKMKRVGNFDVAFDVKGMIGSISAEIILKREDTEYERLEKERIELELRGGKGVQKRIERKDKEIKKLKMSDSLLQKVRKEYKELKAALIEKENEEPENMSYFTELERIRKSVAAKQREKNDVKVNLIRLERSHISLENKEESSKITLRDYIKEDRTQKFKGRTSPYISKEETVEILTRRAIEIEKGSPALYSIPENPKEIAVEEFRNKNLPPGVDLEKLIKDREKKIKSGSLPEIEMQSSYKIAVEEMKRDLIEFEITRRLPDGTEEKLTQEDLIPFDF